MQNNTKSIFGALHQALEHIKDVQSNVTTLNFNSMTLLSDAIFDADIEMSEDAFIALQHQDILTQQLSATSELIEMIGKHLTQSPNEELEKNICASLEVAKAKKEAFSGNAFEQKHEVELF